MSGVKRSYDSSKRKQQAEATRRRLATSARRLFARDGYAVTTIEAIARDAGVAVQTFYATYGSKRAVLLALIDEVERDADIATLRARLQEDASDPRLQLRHIVDFNARLFTRAADILAVLQSAGSADDDLSAIWREGEARRLAGQASLVRAWARASVLQTGLSKQMAADILWSFTGPDTYRLLVTERGWSIARYADWLWSALERLLFASADGEEGSC